VRNRVTQLDVRPVLVRVPGLGEVSCVQPPLDPVADGRQRQLRELIFESRVVGQEELPLPLPDALPRMRNTRTDGSPGTEEKGVRRVGCYPDRADEGVQWHH